MLASPSRFVARGAQAAGFALDAVHAFGHDYAETLRRWLARSTGNSPRSTRRGSTSASSAAGASTSRTAPPGFDTRDDRCRTVHDHPDCVGAAIARRRARGHALPPTPARAWPTAPSRCPRAVVALAPHLKARRRRADVLRHVDLRRAGTGARAREAAVRPTGRSRSTCTTHRDVWTARTHRASAASTRSTKLGYGTPEQRARWGAQMRADLPRRARGDRLTGVYTGRGRGAVLPERRSRSGRSPIPSSRARSSRIWLDPQARRARISASKLLGRR